MESVFEILVYKRNDKSPLEEYLEEMTDFSAKLQIMRRIQRIELGNFGDHKSLGDGLWELRIDCGPGYRIYYCLAGRCIVLLLCAGDKRDQQADIKRALVYKRDFEGK